MKFLSGSEHLKLSIRGFSATRMAYLLNGVQLWLCCSVFLGVYTGDAGAGVDVVSLVLTLANLVLGLCCHRNDKGRLIPFVLALLILFMTDLWTPI
jgi:hypothetical protein